MYIYLCKVKDEPDSCKTDIEKKRGDAYKSALEVDSKLPLQITLSVRPFVRTSVRPIRQFDRTCYTTKRLKIHLPILLLLLRSFSKPIAQR